MATKGFLTCLGRLERKAERRPIGITSFGGQPEMTVQVASIRHTGLCIVVGVPVRRGREWHMNSKLPFAFDRFVHLPSKHGAVRMDRADEVPQLRRYPTP